MSILNYKGKFNPIIDNVNNIFNDEILSVGDSWTIEFPHNFFKKYICFIIFEEPYIVENGDIIIYKGGHCFSIEQQKKIEFNNYDNNDILLLKRKREI